MTEKERNQKAKAWLKRYGDAKRKVDRLKAELDELTAHQEGADAIKYTDMPKAPGIDGDLSDLFVQREKIRTDITKAMTHATMIMTSIRSVIDEIPDPATQEVISLRYISGVKWEKIGDRMNYSLARVHQLHRAGLGEIWRLVHGRNQKST